MRYVSVVGPADADAEVLADAEAVGRVCGERGWCVVTGGLGGVMAAAARGAGEAGGTSIGLLPGAERDAADPAHALALPTGLGDLRNGLVVRAGDAVVVCGGSWGTLSEVALALRSGRRVCGLRGWALPAPAEGYVACPDVDSVEKILVGWLGP